MARRAQYRPPKPRAVRLTKIKQPKLKSLITPKIAGGFATKPTKLPKGISQNDLMKALSKIKEFKLPKTKGTKGITSSQLLTRLRNLTKSSGGRFKL